MPLLGGKALVGVIDNTELAHITANALGANLSRITDKLYVDVSEVTSEYEIVDDGLGNNVLKIQGAELPLSKDYMIKDGKTIKLPGLNVYAPATGKAYVSKKALYILGLL